METWLKWPVLIDYVHKAAVCKVQGRVLSGSWQVTVTKVQGRLLGGGWLVVTIWQSDGLEMEAVFHSLDPSFDAPVLSPPSRW
jgi:hypothetical protein